jgi:hypothetical protein
VDFRLGTVLKRYCSEITVTGVGKFWRWQCNEF